MNIQSLFVPFRCKSLDFKNRIVMPPMTRRRSPEGIPDEAIAACYARRAQHTELVRRLDRGDFDLVAVGRAQLQDPDWAGKVREGRIDDLQGFSKDSLDVLF